MLMLCPECKEKVSDKAHVCPHCGFQIDTLVTCPDCGKLVLPGTIACPVCGYPFSTAGVSSENRAVSPIHPKSGVTLNDKMQEGAHVEASVSITSHDGRNSRRRSSNDSAMTGPWAVSRGTGDSLEESSVYWRRFTHVICATDYTTTYVPSRP